MPGFPFKIIIRVLKMIVNLLEWYSEENGEEKKKIERSASA